MDDKKLEELAQQASHFSTHSGEVEANGIFIALQGATHDAHSYVPMLLSKGILAAVVQKPFSDPRAILVSNTNEAHWKIASYFRSKFKGPVIGVGGSSGKTSTKEILFTLLSKKFKCIKTDKSQNGLLGIPKTLEKLREGVEVAIVEIGIDAPGEMARNVALVRPTHSLLTSIGEEHLLQLKNIETIFAEERILLDDTLKRGGKIYCPMADEYLSSIHSAEQVPATPAMVSPQIVTSQTDKHVLQNMALASKLALDLGMTVQEINEALKGFELLDGRGLKWKLSSDLWVLRDHYNANPSSMCVAFEAAQSFAQAQKKDLNLMLGDMRELGVDSDALHLEIVARARSLGAKNILWVGADFNRAAKNVLPQEQSQNTHEYFLSSSSDELSPELVAKFKQPGVVLVKGSRGTAMEKLMDRVFGTYSAR